MMTGHRRRVKHYHELGLLVDDSWRMCVRPDGNSHWRASRQWHQSYQCVEWQPPNRLASTGFQTLLQSRHQVAAFDDLEVCPGQVVTIGLVASAEVFVQEAFGDCPK